MCLKVSSTMLCFQGTTVIRQRCTSVTVCDYEGMVFCLQLHNLKT